MDLVNHTEALKYYEKTLTSKYFDNLLKIDPTDHAALEGKGEVLAGIGNYPLAIHYYEQALVVSPINVELFHDIANALSKLAECLHFHA